MRNRNGAKALAQILAISHVQGMFRINVAYQHDQDGAFGTHQVSVFTTFPRSKSSLDKKIEDAVIEDGASKNIVISKVLVVA